MEVITIESEAFNKIATQIEEIRSSIERQEKQKPFSDPWLDNDEVCQLLKISKRTLQSYRDEGDLSFSQIGAKIYYKASDVNAFLQQHYNKAFRKR